jgi:formylglycine-generating enzyme required for sulfatase activity
MITLERELKWRRVVGALGVVFCMAGLWWSATYLPAILFPPEPEITNDLGMPFKLIPAGSFDMGSQLGSDEHPVHRVQITRMFYLGQFEVTQAQWQTIIGRSIEMQRDQFDTTWALSGSGPDYPVYYVSWHEVQTFIQRLNELESGVVYRLPTEAEWEYACRAGSPENVTADLDAKAWYINNSGEQAHPVGHKLPNAWGLYDMQGNVWEWCQDWNDDYTREPQVDPKGPETGEFRAVRGGCWHMDADGCRPADRVSGNPKRGNSSLGFRLVREIE